MALCFRPEIHRLHVGVPAHFVGGAPAATVSDLFIEAKDFDEWLRLYEARLPTDRAGAAG